MDQPKATGKQVNMMLIKKCLGFFVKGERNKTPRILAKRDGVSIVAEETVPRIPMHPKQPCPGIFVISLDNMLG
jgi:hypothetical protein